MVLRRWSVRLYYLVLILCTVTTYVHTLGLLSSSQHDCDVNIESKIGGNKSGIFQSPNWPKEYDDDMWCIYRFIGLPNEKVRLNFTHFKVKGVRQRCQDDYLDVYTQVPEPYPDLLDLRLHGRYCGDRVDQLPHLFISMYHVAIIGFYTDDDVVDRGFRGTYEFIDASIYTIGTTMAPQVCGQTIYGHTLNHGTLLSPTYPGMYPDNVACFYKLIGRPGQRIKFTFNDLDIYSGGDHCPYDYVKIYDGLTNEADVIGTYCGKLKHHEGSYITPTVYSTLEALHIEFVTKSGRVEPTKKAYVLYRDLNEDPIKQSGFNASFEISDRFVKLDFIQEGDQHIIGTECDMRVFSHKESNGTIQTPNYPNHYPPGLECKFYIDGLFDKENLEKTKLTFESFEVPSSSSNCSTSYVRAYLSGQDITEDPDKYDSVMCRDHNPGELVSRDPRLLLVFHAGPQSGRGFRAHYQFVTDYAIEGTPSPDPALCHFYYFSKSAKSGTFKSPRNPSHYPPDTTCTYDFTALKNEQVRITFENFELQKNDPNCTHDYVELYMMPHKSRAGTDTRVDLVGRYCQENVPGPMVTDPDVNKARVIFRSDAAFVRAGFRARYEFIRKKSFGDRSREEECDLKFVDQPGGEIKSLHYPLKYPKNETCQYDIQTRKKNARILLQILNFSIEGAYTEESKDYKCANAVLKIFTKRSSRPTYEICSSEISHLPTIISQGNFLRIKFVTSTHATGGKGYRLSWTEILPATAEECDGFRCEKSGHCISSSLRCNKVPNCGAGDTSDEPAQCDTTYSDHGVLHIILGVVISLIALVFMVVCILHRRRKARKKKNKKEIEVRYVTRGSTPNRGGGPATDKLLKERTEKVSIV